MFHNISNTLTRRLAEIRGGDDTMANHPSRKRSISADHTYIFIANIGLFQKRSGATATRTWASGPTHNNRPASRSIASSDLNDFADHVLGMSRLAHNPDARRAFMAALQEMPETTDTEARPTDDDYAASDVVGRTIDAYL